jgi:hypothetical protein
MTPEVIDWEWAWLIGEDSIFSLEKWLTAFEMARTFAAARDGGTRQARAKVKMRPGCAAGSPRLRGGSRRAAA